MKKREEAWVKIEGLAKQNPTFPLISPSLPNCDSPFGMERFAMIDEDIGEGGDELLDEFVSFNDKCDTQVCVDLYFVIIGLTLHS